MPSRQVSWGGRSHPEGGCCRCGHRALSHGLCPLPGLRILLVDQWVETGGTMQAAIQLVERLGGVVAGRGGAPGHPRVYPCVQRAHRARPLWWPRSVSPQASLPSASRTARAGGGSGSGTSAPTASPPTCSPASTATSWAGTNGVGLATRGSPAPRRGERGHQLLRTGARGAQPGPHHGSHPPLVPSSCLPMSLGAAPGAGGTRGQPPPQPHTVLKKHKKGFIQTNRSPGGCLPSPGFA